jgi:hypothetical protein
MPPPRLVVQGTLRLSDDVIDAGQGTPKYDEWGAQSDVNIHLSKLEGGQEPHKETLRLIDNTIGSSFGKIKEVLYILAY